MNFPVRIPQIIKWLYPDYIWDKSSFTENEKVMYLTFDDGPTPEITPWVLERLEDYNAKATFFLVGNNAAQYPELLSDILSKGHAIGNHSRDHLNGWKTKSSVYIDNIEKAERCIKTILEKENNANDATVSPVKLFRPPFGMIKGAQAKTLMKKGYQIIMYDVLARDWDDRLSGTQCAENVIKNAKVGSIVVFHDSVKAEGNLKVALPKVLKYYQDLGFSFATLY